MQHVLNALIMSLIVKLAKHWGVAIKYIFIILMIILSVKTLIFYLKIKIMKFNV